MVLVVNYQIELVVMVVLAVVVLGMQMAEQELLGKAIMVELEMAVLVVEVEELVLLVVMQPLLLVEMAEMELHHQ
jgi:hypothetical protein